MKWVLSIALTVVLAATLARRAQAASSSSAPIWTGLSDDVLGWLEPRGEPIEQLPSIFESAIVNASPSSYITPSNAPTEQAANLGAFLAMIRFAEGTDREADPYRVCYGYGHTIGNLGEHPAVSGEWRGARLPDSMCTAAGLGPGCISTAAGAYQIIKPTWLGLRGKLGLRDFGQASQDACAVELIRQRGALNDVYAGRFAEAVRKVAPVWASMPGAGYAQPERKLNILADAYRSAGGTIEV